MRLKKTTKSMINKLFFCIVTLLLLVTSPLFADQRWEGTWATAPEFTGSGDMPKASLSNRAARQIIHVSMGGSTLRMQLSNHFSNGPVDISAVYVADPADTPQGKTMKQETDVLPCNARINAKTVRYLTFNHKRSLTLDAGKDIYSDAFRYQLRPGQRLAVTVVYGKRTPEHATSHRGSRTTTYILAGKGAPKADFSQGEKADHWYNITRLEVLGNTPHEVIAVLGNSITDGRGSTTNLQNRWTDFFSDALNGIGICCESKECDKKQESTRFCEDKSCGKKQESAQFCKSTADCCQKGIGVLNLGIGGNCVVRGGLSEPALVRFNRDILSQPNITKLIIFEGTNDIGCCSGNYEKMVQEIINAYQTLIDKAHAKGIKVYGATITPTKGNGWYSYFHEAMRQTVNEWIRKPGHFDALIDFDALVRDPADPQRLRADYSDDWLHLNPKGYAAIGQYAAKIVR